METKYLDDKLNTADKLYSGNGARRRGSSHAFDTEVIVRNELNEELFRKSNTIIMGGRRFTLEKIFNIVPPTVESRITLNEIFGVNLDTTDIVSGGPRKEQMVALFGVGRGGSGLSFGTVINPTSRENNLYDQVPFRYVLKTNDLSAEEQLNYYLKVEEGDYYAYYLKAFEIHPEVIMKIGDQDFIPSIDDNTPATEGIDIEDVETYVELTLKISKNDVREFYIANGGIQTARINELALYLGFQPSHADGVWADYREIEGFSKLTFDNEPFSSETKELNIIYRIYI